MPRYLLTVKKVQALKEPGRYSDGGGLYLHVGKGDARSWIMRIMQRGKRHDIGLGSAHFVTLEEARDFAYEIRKQAKEGGSVEAFIRKRRDEQAEVKTVEQAARLHFDEASAGLAQRTRDLWMSRLEEHVFSKIGNMLIKEVVAKDIKDLLLPLADRPETAHRVRSRLNQLFDWAITEGQYQAANPVATVKQGKHDKAHEPKHHVALPWLELPAFMADLQGRGGASARCLELLILTASRSVEVRGAQWDEFDLEAGIWTVPAERMKGKLNKRKVHEVPLSSKAIEVIESVRGLHPDLLFSSPRGKVLSNMTFKSLFKRMDQNEITAHGFRSTFADWATVKRVCDPELVECALAHRDEKQVRSAYVRDKLLERRKPLMETWARFATGQKWKKLAKTII